MDDRRSVHEISRKKALAKKILKIATLFICHLFACILYPGALLLTQDQQDECLNGRTAQKDISKNKKGKNKSKVRIKPIPTDDKVNGDLEESTLNEHQGEVVHEKKEEQIQWEVHEKKEQIQWEVHEKTKQRPPNDQMFMEYQVHQRVPAESEEEISKRKLQKELQEKTKKRKAEQEEQRKRNERRMKLEKDIKDKEARVKELKSEKEALKKDYKKKLPDYTKVLKKLRIIPEAEDTYYSIIKKLIDDVVEKELETLLTAPVVERKGCIATVTSGDREQYGAYGLLLSAYKFLHPSLTIDEDMIEKVCSRVAKDEKEEKELFVQLEGKMKEKAAANAETSLKLTQEMLFLIPPLVVGSKGMVDSYHEDLCDTNRKTWVEERKGDQLLWYRPVLMYGNHLHIAVKGLVGNCTEPIKEEEKKPEGQTDTETNEGVIMSPEITMHDDPGETSDANEDLQNEEAEKKPEGQTDTNEVTKKADSGETSDTNDESQDDKETLI